MAQVNRGSGKRTGSCRLQSVGWNDQTRRALERLIDRGAGKKLPVVFDFDNTLVRGDLQEATLAVLARAGKLTPQRLPAMSSPAFRLPDGKRIALDDCADITEYYEAFLSPTIHGERDPTPLANSYAWAIEAFAGLQLSEVLEATETVGALSRQPVPGFVEATPGRSRYPVPSFHPQMVELVAELIRHRFDVWIVSGSNVWGVRWMVLHELNPQLRRLGVRTGLRADHIIGGATLLADQRDRLYKDALLVRENPRYAALDKAVCRQFRLTSRLQYPVPTYSGKVACIFDAIGCPPYLCVGDSPGDHAMMTFSQNRLWIARLEKQDFQEQTAQLIRQTGYEGWLLQATLASGEPGFVSELDPAPARLASWPRHLHAAAGTVSNLSRKIRGLGKSRAAKVGKR